MSYNQYLGSLKCCNLDKLGPQGPIGQRGPQGAIGPVGATGAPGSYAGKGDTGATGSTGAQGATGPSPNQNLANVLLIGNNAGTTGIDMNSQNIFTANSVSCDIGSGITSTLDTTTLTMINPIAFSPTTYITTLTANALTNSLIGVSGFGSVFQTQILEMSNYSYVGYDQRYFQVDGLTDPQYPSLYMRDESGYRATLKGTNLSFYNEGTGGTYSVGVNANDFQILSGSDRLLLNSGIAESYWGDFSIGTNANIALNVGGACRADIDTRADGIFSVGDINGAGANTKIVLNDNLNSIVLSANVAIELDSIGGSTTLGDVQGSINGTTLSVTDATEKIQLTAGTGVKLVSSSIQYPCNFWQISQSLDDRSTYVNTFFGTSLVATLPLVDSANVGTQYLITNTNASALSVTGQSGQLIYSSTAPASSTTRSLAEGNSQIFTAIYTTSAGTFGWSMV